MNKAIVSVIAVICFSNFAIAATWAPTDSSLPAPASDVAILKEVGGGRFNERTEVLSTGTVRITVLVKESDLWIEKEIKEIMAVSADTVKLLIGVPRAANPVTRVVVPRNPACDSISAAVYIRNPKTNELDEFYQYNGECGQMDLGVFNRPYDTKTIISLMNLAEGVRVLLR